MQRYTAAAILLALVLCPLLIRASSTLYPLFDVGGPYFPILQVLPWISLPLAGWLGVRLNQNKVFFLVLLYALVLYLLSDQWLPAVVDSPLLRRAEVLVFTLPLSMFMILLLRESRLAGLHSVAKLALVVLPTLLALALVRYDVPYASDFFTYQFFPTPIPFPHTGVLWLIGLVALLFRQRAGALNLIILAAVLGIAPLYYLLAHIIGGSARDADLPICVGSSAVMLLYGIYRLYWQRVYIDELTQIKNRRALDENMRFLSNRFAIAMVDIDHFKSFNDKHGHQAGDQLLRMVAQHLVRGTSGKVYRYGGEEFCVVFDKTSSHEATQAIDKVRDTLARRLFTLRRPEAERQSTSWRDRGKRPVIKEKRVHITVSAGVAKRKESLRTVEQVIAQADKALYRAKRRGRNRVVSA